MQHACWQGSAQDKGPVIDITMFLQKQKNDDHRSYNVIDSI